MKTLRNLLPLAFFLALASGAAHADTSCQSQIVEAVQAQVPTDFPGQDLVVIPPDMQGWDGGEVQFLSVDVSRNGNASDVVAVYKVMIDEVCSVEIQGYQPVSTLGNACAADQQQLLQLQNEISNYPGRDDRPGTPSWAELQINLQAAQQAVSADCPASAPLAR